MKSLLRRIVPARAVPVLRSARAMVRRRVSSAASADGLRPLSDVWGLDRGTPIDLHYLERFLEANSADIRGRTLETGDARHARRFGREVTHSDVLHLFPGNPNATIVGDLAAGDGLPSDAYDCIVLTNTLLLIYEVRAALQTCQRMLRPGGTLLAHFSGLVRSQTSPQPWGPPGWEGEADYWRFTSASARRVCEDVFGRGQVSVTSYGNVRSVAAALYGLAVEDLRPDEVDHHDPRYELVIGVRAVRSQTK